MSGSQPVSARPPSVSSVNTVSFRPLPLSLNGKAVFALCSFFVFAISHFFLSQDYVRD